MANKPRFGFPLEYVSNIEAARRFCVDVLGLEVERVHPTFVQFKDRAGATFAISNEEPLGGGDDLELYWMVDDAETAFRDLSQRAEVCLPLMQMPFGKVFGIKDPAGQPHYVVEFVQDRPSRPVAH